MLSFTRKERKYWLRAAGVIAPSTLRNTSLRILFLVNMFRWRTLPGILVEWFDFDHVMHGKDKPLECDIVLVLDNHDHLVDGALFTRHLELSETFKDDWNGWVSPELILLRRQ